MSRNKSSRTQRWLSIIVPTAILVAGVLILGQQAMSGSSLNVMPTPNGTARVSYEEPKRAETQAGQSLIVRMNNWQATDITGGCHKTN